MSELPLPYDLQQLATGGRVELPGLLLGVAGRPQDLAEHFELAVREPQSGAHLEGDGGDRPWHAASADETFKTGRTR